MSSVADASSDSHAEDPIPIPEKRRRGRPFVIREPPLTAYQEGLVRKEADKIKEVDDLMKKNGFMSIRQYLEAFFSNKHFRKGQGFFLRHGNPTGFEATLELWLKDGRLDDLPRSRVMEDWATEEALYEFECLLEDQRSCLRHMSWESVADGFQAVRSEDFYEEVKSKAPMLWRIFSILSRKEAKEGKQGDEEFNGDKPHGDQVALTSLLNLLYARNQQANGYQSLMSIYFRAQGIGKKHLRHCIVLGWLLVIRKGIVLCMR